MLSFSWTDWPLFGNSQETINWNYQSGGYDVGQSFNSYRVGGELYYSTPETNYSAYNNFIPGGNAVFPWENTAVSESSFINNNGRGESTASFSTRVMIAPSDQAAIGTTATYLVQAQAWHYQNNIAGAQLLPGSMNIQGNILMPVTNEDGSVYGNTIVQGPAGVKVDVTPHAEDPSALFNVKVTQLNMQMSVDNNRDGKITTDVSDLTTALRPYRFWINDSQENGDIASDADQQIPGQQATVQVFDPTTDTSTTIPVANYAENEIYGRSDLVNYFPVELNFSNALQVLPPSSGYEYHLVSQDSAVKFVYTTLVSTNASDYFTNITSTGYGVGFNEPAASADTLQVLNASGTVLDTNWLAQIQAGGGSGIILLEGCASTSQPLWLEIWRDGKPLAGTPLYISINGVEQMFRHLNLSAYGNGTVDVASRASAPNEPTTENKNLVFLHGYNVNQQQARGVESEMFKRFYWSGSKAKFYGVTWNGSQSQITSVGFTPDLQTNIVNALLTASPLASFLSTLSGDTIVASHSLGNVVVLSAISDYNAPIDKYFMIDAALPMEAIQGNTTVEPAMLYSAWQDYSNRLYASDWWKLFPADDARSTLTWSNRLGNLHDVDVYNFYSGHEEVLREDTDDPPLGILGTGAQEVVNAIGFWGGVGLPFGTYAWVWQEKGKGTDTSDTFVGSSHGGWKFNDTAYGTNVGGIESGPVIVHMSPTVAASLSNSQLQTNAFFDFSSDSDTEDLALLGSSGSTYAQANHDRILSDAIPALTLPVGANWISRLAPQNGDDNNFDMELRFETGWPAARSTGLEAYNWHHSDFDYVAYPYTHKLFDEIVNDGNLK
jgi:pimeloyl-ACP methyl ester carboxylesterase